MTAVKRMMSWLIGAWLQLLVLTLVSPPSRPLSPKVLVAKAWHRVGV